MMAFHKPKIYKSVQGCCICKAKSSSSRFTFSDKYSEAFRNCFSLLEEREGDICNACVLLVKRWRKLPEGSSRNWSHVVDARAGPGTRSFVRRPKPRETPATTATTAAVQPTEEIRRHKHVYRRKKRPAASADASRPNCSGSGPAAVAMGSRFAMNRRGHLYLVPQRITAGSSLLEEADYSDSSSIRSGTPSSMMADCCSFFDSDYWTREETSCGPIYRGEHGELVLDLRFAAPAAYNPAATATTTALLPTAGERRLPRFSPLSAVESLIAAELQSLTAAASSSASFRSCESDGAKSSVDEEDMEDEEDIDFYCNESIEDLKRHHQGSNASGATAAADDLDDEGFFDRPLSHGSDDMRRQQSGVWSVIVQAPSPVTTTAAATSAMTRNVRRSLVPFS